MNVGHLRQLIYLSRQPSEPLHQLLIDQGWQVKIAASAREAQRILRNDTALGGLFDLSSGYSEQEMTAFEPYLMLPSIGWVALADEARLSESMVQRLIGDYCYDYLIAPAANDKLVDSIDRAFKMAALGVGYLAANAATAPPLAEHSAQMVGSCETMQQLFRIIGKVANTDAAVFIAGESGTGKELTARAIHQQSRRASAAFVTINCGAIPHHLLQSELFGYERGAFTGANARKIGRVEAANGGTLFLDEIGDLPLESQASLLRFLQEGRIERLGGRESTEVNVRIISATHVDLEAAMRDGRFRADLFHRLCVLRVNEPPLRMRGKDIEILAHHMLQKFRTDNARRIRGFTASAIEAMYNYGWPGNVRELINRVRRAIVMCEGRLITPTDLELQDYATVRLLTLAQAREQAERRAIEDALLRHRNRLNEAAQALGVSRVTLYRLMSAHGLRGAPDEPRVLPHVVEA